MWNDHNAPFRNGSYEFGLVTALHHSSLALLRYSFVAAALTSATLPRYGLAQSDPVGRDVANSLGLNFRTFGATEGETPAFDYDGDKRIDLLLSTHNEGEWPLLRNTGSGFKVALTLPWNDRHGCAAADLGSPTAGGLPDGRPDLYCVTGACGGNCNREYPNSLFLQTSDHRFVDVARKWNVADVHGRGRVPLILDVDRDGKNDIVVLNAGPSTAFPPAVSRLYRNVGGSFVEVKGGAVSRELWGECGKAADIDGDKWTDVMVCSRKSSASATMTLKNNEGKLVDVSASTPYRTLKSRELDIADVNGDGKNDILILEFTRLSVWLNVGGKHPRMNYSFKINKGRDIAVGDVNLDGCMDIYIAQGSNEKFRDIMLINDGNGVNYHEIPIPQIKVGESDVATAIPNWNGTKRAAFLVSNAKWNLGPGPYQLIEFSAR
jgi:hypothetical protein